MLVAKATAFFVVRKKRGGQLLFVAAEAAEKQGSKDEDERHMKRREKGGVLNSVHGLVKYNRRKTKKESEATKSCRCASEYKYIFKAEPLP